MNAIDLMIEEHKLIKRMLAVTRKISIKVLNNEEVDYNDFNKVIDFVRNFADKHHHNKEEVILFKKMGDILGERIANGPIMGMLVEHDLGRLFIGNLETALIKFKGGDNDSRVDIIANAIGYTDLLYRHIEKEDTTIYTFAQRKLNKEQLSEIDFACLDVEKEAKKNNLQDTYITLLKELESKIG
ncbi:hemerythrin domain-containing protein [Clostridium estertheticum]|uniref:hemerythrin domain-containing protein n=1 Tax=Clostridium estertheticum TaxID=238834 RepID=UPI001CF1AA29|nr:hemerythrin domain-containing protein [Clostridium estertheticum]MCB2305404.1 hemerythrin domain-containing protein [Clostridium estertheticum]MCB2343842.1 hemerythrin domain-containing protein [Clostridium estertheticum]MCB2348760.1 hemerythrin domain-containing protein [Clostridium estertheticum]WAG46082.1 hemerythrin domain-containing protein [Clostridium estertheticum]